MIDTPSEKREHHVKRELFQIALVFRNKDFLLHETYHVKNCEKKEYFINCRAVHNILLATLFTSYSTFFINITEA